VYAGHAAIALALKAHEPRVPLAPLVLACYGPDWAELVFGLAYGRGTMQVLAHSIPAVLVGGLSAAGLFALVAHRHGARYLLLGWLLHWPADYLTAHKPLIDLQHRVGLDLYHRPAIDFLLEGTLVAVCCAIYARAFARDTVQRRWVVAMAVALLGMQAVLDYGLRSAAEPWNPSLSDRLWRPHHSIVFVAALPLPIRMALALSPTTDTAREQWRQIDHGALPR
jgi:hypothetical protein